MDISKHRILLGIIIILAGIFFLLKEIIFPQLGNCFFPVILMGGGLVFIYFYFKEQNTWWAAIPGVILVTFGGAAALSELPDNLVPENLVAAFILGGISMAFLAVYAKARQHWWAIIPAGILLTLSFNAFINWENGGLFLLGMAATFGILFVLPGNKQPWAIFPASILGGLGILVLFISFDLFRYIIPLIVLGAGIFLIVKSLRES
ncbi:MAG TPA: hypothetical protein PKW33_08755 [Anaerolineaceae bacterium]|nr:hypothetical protein [Anaerolineaceae bacterium]HPN51664.1 hypothetical protein [Anaerolineaceae bacterium]